MRPISKGVDYILTCSGKWISIVLAIVLLIPVLAGCAGNTNTPGSSNNASTADTDRSETVEITWFQ